VQELEQALLAERIAAQRDRATITKLQRQINKVYFYVKYSKDNKFVSKAKEKIGNVRNMFDFLYIIFIKIFLKDINYFYERINTVQIVNMKI